MAKVRNNFIHGVPTPDYVEAGYVEPGYQATSAKNAKRDTIRSTSELRGLRDRAACLSCLVAHIDHLMKEVITGHHDGEKDLRHVY